MWNEHGQWVLMVSLAVAGAISVPNGEASLMWYTTLGERTLSGPEAELIREAVGFMYDQIDDEDLEDVYEVGIEAFDRLSRAQKLAMLAEVSSALLCEDCPAPDVTAIRAATVGAIYETVRVFVEMEIDSEGFEKPDHSCRAKVAALHGGDDLPNLTCTDLDEWGYVVEGLQDRVLADEDWDMEHLFLDLPPDKAAQLKQFMNISDDYFASVPPDPSPAELRQIRSRLNELTGARH